MCGAAVSVPGRLMRCCAEIGQRASLPGRGAISPSRRRNFLFPGRAPGKRAGSSQVTEAAHEDNGPACQSGHARGDGGLGGRPDPRRYPRRGGGGDGRVPRPRPAAGPRARPARLPAGHLRPRCRRAGPRGGPAARGGRRGDGGRLRPDRRGLTATPGRHRARALRPPRHRDQQRRDHPGRPGAGGAAQPLRGRGADHGARPRPPGAHRAARSCSARATAGSSRSRRSAASSASRTCCPTAPPSSPPSDSPKGCAPNSAAAR